MRAKGLRGRILEGETTFGCWLTLVSWITAELVGAAGYDWALVDLEHGAGTEGEVGQQRPRRVGIKTCTRFPVSRDLQGSQQ